MKKIYCIYRREYAMPAMLLMLLFLLILPSLVKAEGDLEITGSVQIKTAASITVNSIEFLVNQSTMISSNMNMSVSYDSIKVGSYVRIDAKSNLTGKFEATAIQLINTKINLEISGTITARTANTITVNGSNIFVDANTIIYTQFHAALTYSSLNIGDSVIIKATQTIGGQLTAVVIIVKTKNTNKEIELNGKIQLLETNSLTLLNTKFIVNASTIIMAEGKGVIKFSDLTVGDDVEVRGFLQQDSTYLALSVKVEKKEYEQGKLEVEGAITLVTGNSITVNTIVFAVDSSTIVYAHEGTVLAFSDLKVGDKVEVKALLQSNGSYRAVSIELESENSEKGIVVAGLIDVVNSDNVEVGKNRIYVNSRTQIYSQTHQRTDFTSLKVGTYIIAKASLQSGNYTASSIKIRDNSKNEYRFTGPIEAINGSSITVKGLIFVTGSSTEFVDENRNTITINDLKVGQIISLEAQLQSGNQYTALKIIARKFWRPTVMAEGSIENLTLTSITVMGKVFAVDSSTLVVGTGSGVITFASLTLGTAVEVKGSLNTSGVLTAKLIKVHTPHEFRIYGKIEIITGTNFNLGGLTFTTDQNTVIYDQFDKVVLFDSLKVNQSVEVRYVKTSLNENLAVKIEIESDPLIVKFVGVVTSSTSGKLQLTVPSFAINSNTIFVTSAYTQTQSSSVQAGQSVTVWARQNQSGSLSAVQVQQITASVTAINEGETADLPSTYELKQNYPNPFNPTTDIAFTLARQEQVRLIVYNIIGQQVVTLVNGPLSAGSHVVKFNALNLPSGVYLYRLEAGNYTNIKKMILLK